jgi:hypothetical protein
MKNIYEILVWKPEGKRPLGKSRRRFENNIKCVYTNRAYDIA